MINDEILKSIERVHFIGIGGSGMRPRHLTLYAKWA